MTMTIRIMVIDDDEDLLAIATRFLEEKDPKFELYPVATGQEALRLLEEERFDAIVCDYFLGPECMNGLEILEWVRAESRDMPFIMFTGRSKENVAIRALNLGADYYLRKGVEDIEGLYSELALYITNAVRAKRAKESLWEQRETFASVLQRFRGSVLLLDNKIPPRIISCNSAAIEMLGYVQEDMIGRAAETLFPNPEAYEIINKALHQGSSTSGFQEIRDLKMVTADDSILTVDVNLILLIDEQDTHSGWLTTIHSTLDRNDSE